MIPDRIACDSCRIEMHEVMTIGDTAGPSILTGRPGHMVTDGRGRYWIGVLDAFPLLYDSTTRALSQFAKQGSGPGEFRRPQVVAYLPGDSLLVYDGLTLHVVSPEMASARTIADREQLRMQILRWPDRVLGITNSDRRGAGRIIELRTVAGVYDFSGPSAQVVDTILTTPWINGRDAGAWASSLRHSGEGPGMGDDIWIAHYNTYKLVRYSPAGDPLDSIMRQPDWFPGGDALKLGGPDQPTTPRLIAHWLDDAGRMWIVASRPRKDTRDAWKDVPAGPEGAMEVSVAALPAEYELNDNVIEVIDVRAKRVLARYEFDGYISAVLPDNHVASFVETASGVPVLTIHRLALR